MYKLIIDKPHANTIKEAFISYFHIRQNNWKEYLHDIKSLNTDEIELLFQGAYEIASPDYKDIYKPIEENSGFNDDIVQLHIKIFKDDFTLKTKEELRTLLMIVEEFMRMRMGQFMDFVDDVAHNGWEYNKDEPGNDKKFDEYINRRNEAHKLFDNAYYNSFCDRYKSEKVLIAEDLYDVIKHQIWLDTPSMQESFNVWSYEPMLWSNYKMPQIKKEN